MTDNTLHTFDEYDAFAENTACYPKEQGLPYCSLGLAGEVGEYCEGVKRITRGDYKLDDYGIRLKLARELGDVLWYLSRCSSEIGYDLKTIATINRDKLQSRKNRGVIKGSGDER